MKLNHIEYKLNTVNINPDIFVCYGRINSYYYAFPNTIACMDTYPKVIIVDGYFWVSSEYLGVNMRTYGHNGELV